MMDEIDFENLLDNDLISAMNNMTQLNQTNMTSKYEYTLFL